MAKRAKDIDENLHNGFYEKYVGQFVKRFYTPFKEENIFEIKDFRMRPDVETFGRSTKFIEIPEFLYKYGEEEWWADVEDSVVITDEKPISDDERVANVNDPHYKGYNPFTKTTNERN